VAGKEGFNIAADVGRFSREGTGTEGRLLYLANQAASTKPALLLRNFLGTFHCCKCGTRANIDALGL
jgi:hypothetical protein